MQQLPELSSHMGWYSAPGLNFGVGQLRKRGSLGLAWRKRAQKPPFAPNIGGCVLSKRRGAVAHSNGYFSPNVSVTPNLRPA